MEPLQDQHETKAIFLAICEMPELKAILEDMQVDGSGKLESSQEGTENITRESLPAHSENLETPENESGNVRDTGEPDGEETSASGTAEGSGEEIFKRLQKIPTAQEIENLLSSWPCRLSWLSRLESALPDLLIVSSLLRERFGQTTTTSFRLPCSETAKQPRDIGTFEYALTFPKWRPLNLKLINWADDLVKRTKLLANGLLSALVDLTYLKWGTESPTPWWPAFLRLAARKWAMA